MYRQAFLLAAFCGLFLLSSCSNYQQVLKGKDYDAKFEMALKYYNKKNYYKAYPLFEELMAAYRGQAKAERVYYYYAYCNYHSGDYESAAYDFDNFARTFPNSEYAEECAFMHAQCYYEDSPGFSLDQTNTVKAIDKLQLFVDRYPASNRLEKCNAMIDELRFKLETKDFENAQLYYGTNYYKAAVTAFRNVIDDYPSTRYREECMYMILKSQYAYADGSADSKKQERLQQAMNYANEFNAAYPESKFRKDALSITENIKRKLEKISGNTITLK